MDKHGEKSLNNGIVVVSCFGFLLIGFMAGLAGGTTHTIRNIKKEAVLKGAAEYVVDESGNPVFQWKENK